MKSVAEFMSRLIPLVPACPEPLAEQAITDSAIDFCERTTVLRVDADAFTTVAGTSLYDIDVPSNHLLSRVIYVTVDGYPIHGEVTESLPALDSYTGKPTNYYIVRDDSEILLKLFPTPDDAYTVALNLAVRPTVGAAYLADDLYNYWVEAVVAGAAYRVKAIPGQPFSDPVGAEYYNRRCKILCNNARNESNIGRIVGSVKAQPRPFV
jgi:hypothetical protein